VSEARPLTLAEVQADARRYGPIAYLGTVSPSGRPYTSPVAVNWIDDELVAFVATPEAKVANVRANGRMTAHYAVSEATGWDSCVLWGDARVVDTTEGRRALWDRMGYDLSRFEPGGPEADSHVFLVMTPTKAVILRNYGIAGREEWKRS
jgi:nitroimidazol reductase NimA-like FMN-containing flavoprotein (pyridoxamine 5'-phosphate oxidase superfamily)